MRRTGNAHYTHISCGKNKSTLFVKACDVWVTSCLEKGEHSFLFCLMWPASQLALGEEEGSSCYLSDSLCQVYCVTCLVWFSQLIGRVVSIPLMYTWKIDLGRSNKPAKNPPGANGILTSESGHAIDCLCFFNWSIVNLQFIIVGFVSGVLQSVYIYTLFLMFFSIMVFTSCWI